jgi:hypothetical protein
VSQECLFGRLPSCGIQLEHLSASRAHAQLSTDGAGNLFLTDLGSGEAVEGQEGGGREGAWAGWAGWVGWLCGVTFAAVCTARGPCTPCPLPHAFSPHAHPTLPPLPCSPTLPALPCAPCSPRHQCGWRLDQSQGAQAAAGGQRPQVWGQRARVSRCQAAAACGAAVISPLCACMLDGLAEMHQAARYDAVVGGVTRVRNEWHG